MSTTGLRGLGPRELLRAASRHRALLSAGLAAAAVAAGLGAVTPAPEASVSVLTASRDLPGGTTLAVEDLTLAPVPQDLLPSGALTDPGPAVGRLVAGPVRRGEALTDVRLLGGALLSSYAGTPEAAGTREAGSVAVPLRLAEPAAARLVRAGDRIDVLAADPEGGDAASVAAADVLVLAVPTGEDTTEGSLLVVSVDRTTASRLAAAAVSSRLSLAVLPP